MPPTIMDREFIDLWTRIPRFIGRLSTSASSHHDLSLAAFITNIAGSDFRYTQGLVRADLPVSLSSSASRGSSAFGACLRARIGSFLPALAAFAATPCDDIGEIIAAVIVGNLSACSDVLDGTYDDLVAYRVGLGIGPARMICVTSEVLSARSVDRPTAMYDDSRPAGVKLLGGVQ